MRHKLSIITVNYNNCEGLKKTFKSIEDQSFCFYEHIIIDAGSTDGSVDAILEYEKENPHLKYWISEPDRGIYDGMNKGIERSNGEYLFFLNSGDCLIKDILKDINFDGTEYIYGNIRIIKNKKVKVRIPPEIPDLIYLCNNSLPHQACFIHRKLFYNKKYDIDYKIISDWAHSFSSLIIERCSYHHIPIVISEFDGNGISSNRTNLKQERIEWFQNNFPIILSKSFINCAELEDSNFRSVIPLLCRTKKFKKRMKTLVLFLYKINSFFSNSKRMLF